MAGQALTSDLGSLGRGVTLALAGLAIAVSAGTVIPGSGGQQITPGQGSVTQSISVALTGDEITGAAGTVVGDAGQLTLTGQSITSESGTVVAGGQPVTVNISGVECAAVAGFVDSLGQALTGSEVTCSAGTPVLSLTLALTGSEMASGHGSVFPGIDADDTFITVSYGSAVGSFDVALVGEESAIEQGSVAVTGDVTLELTGEETVVEDGDLAYDRAFPITGSEIVSAIQTMGAPGGAFLSGQEVAVSAGEVHTTNDRTYALVGQELTVGQGLAVTSALAFPTGQFLTVSAQEIGPRGATLVGESISVEIEDFILPSGKKPGKSKTKPPKEKSKKLVVTIDDEDFIVESKEEAEYLLSQARQTYEEQIAEVGKQLVARKIVKPLKMPKIRASGPATPERDALIAEVAALRADLKVIFDQAAEAVRKARQDDEEAIALLL